MLAECVLSTLADARAALAEMARVLRPDGALLFSDLYDRGPGRGGLLPSLGPGRASFEALGRAGLRAEVWQDHTGGPGAALLGCGGSERRARGRCGRSDAGARRLGRRLRLLHLRRPAADGGVTTGEERAMSDTEVRVRRARPAGPCCTQIMAQLALERRREQNRQMVDAVGALCNGLFSGLGCGALAGGAVAMWLLAGSPVDGALVEELVDWLLRTGTARRPATASWAAIPGRRLTQCPLIVAETYDEAVTLLAAAACCRRRLPDRVCR